MDGFLWLFSSLSVIFTVLPAIMYFGGEKAEAIKIFTGWWLSVIFLFAFTATMMFIVKPVIVWFLDLLF